jgi:formate dehydrogenase subunit gamma
MVPPDLLWNCVLKVVYASETMTGRSPWSVDEANRIIDQCRMLEGAALPILHAMQERFGYVDRAAIGLIAEALNLSRAEIHGIVTFYHDFRDAPVDGPVLRLCRAESCQAMGCENLVAHLAAAHGLSPDKADPKDRLRIETVYCLGNCALSPAALLDDEPIGRLDASRIDAIVHECSRSQ